MATPSCSSSKYVITSQFTGDTFAGLDITLNVNGSPLDLTTATIRVQFRKADTLALELTEISGITITDAMAGQFSLDPFPITLAPFTYDYDIEITIGATIRTYVYGTWVVKPDVSHD